MTRSTVTDPNAAEFMDRMRGMPADLIAKAMSRRCVNAISFARCSKSSLARAWANSCTTDHHRARFETGTTLASLRADADAYLQARKSRSIWR